MNFEAEEELKRLEYIRQNAEFEAQKIQENKKRAKWAYRVFLSLFPYFLFLHFGILLISLFSSKKAKEWKARFIRLYFRYFFRLFKGLPYYMTNDSSFPKKGKPCLIFGLKNNVFSSLYSYHLFPYPIVIPLLRDMVQFRACAFLPFTFLGKAFEVISYTDAPLSQSLPNIRYLLKAGYPVFVYANDHYQDSLDPSVLYLNSAIIPLLKEEVDIYFLSQSGFEAFTFSNGFFPTLVRCELAKKEVIFSHISFDNSEEIGTRIARFFGFETCQFILSKEG